MKKVLSLVLVIAMVLSSFSFAFAAPKFEDVVDTDYEKAINTLVGLGVVTGYEDGTYRPERIVTRAEMAKLIVEILGYGKLVAGSKSNFTDTQGHWADAWIALAAGRGLVIGTGDGKFTPDRQVSYDEAITMVVRALGYTDDSNELKGMTWPTNFKVKAADLKLTKDVNLSSTGADRGGVAQLLFNALEANLVTIDTDGNVNYIKDGDENKILLNTLASKDRFVVATKHLDEDHKEYKGDIVDLAPYMYQDIKVFVNDDDEVVYVTKVESEVKVGEFRTHADSNYVNVRIDGKNTKTLLANATSTAVYYNGVEVFMDEAELEASNTADPVGLHKAAATFVLNDKDQIVGIVAEKATDVRVVVDEYAGKAKFEGYMLPLDDDDDVDYDKLTVKGAVDALEDIEEDDVIVLFAGAGVNARSDEPEKLTIQVVRDTVEGRVTRIDEDSYYIDGVEYDVSATRGTFSTALDLGDTGLFFLDHQGNIVEFDGSGSGPSNYAVVIGTAPGKTTSKFTSYSVDDYPQLKLSTQDNETVVFDIQVKVSSSNGNVSSSAKIGSANIVENATNSALVINGIGNDDLIKYSLNSDGRISKVEIVKADVEAYLTDTNPLPAKIDLDKNTNRLVSNVVVFEANEDYDEYEVVDPDVLPTEFLAFADRNSNGEIRVLVVKAGEIEAGADTFYAYITKVNAAYNDDDDEVQAIEVYVGGEKKTLLTTEELQINENQAYAIKYDGKDVKSATVDYGTVVTATAINARVGNIQLNNVWYALTETATVIGVKANNDVNIRDLYDIEVGDSITVFRNTDQEVDLIIISE